MVFDKAIYLDMDDVICETCRSLLHLLENEFGRRVAFEDIVQFDLAKSFGMTSEEIEIFMTRAHQPDVLAGVKPVPGARETVSMWIEAGYDIFVMTGRPPTTIDTTRKWLSSHGVEYQRLHFVDKYGRIGKESSFTEALTLDDLAEMRFRLAVEDSAATANFLHENGVAPVAILDRPWNRGQVGAGIERVMDWQQLATVFAAP